MNTFGRHLLVEYFGCDPAVLDDEDQIRTLMRGAAREAGATEVAVVFHRFAPQGVSGVVVVEESHLSIHTWPECGYAAVDFYTCGECIPERAREHLKRGLGATGSETVTVDRGLHGRDAMRLRAHERQGHGSPEGAEGPRLVAQAAEG